MLGVWSLILSTTSIAGVATMGLTSSMVKYTASLDSKLEPIEVNRLIQTGTILISSLNTGIVFIIYFLAVIFIPLAIPKTELDLALKLLPFSLASLWLNGFAGIFLSTLEGLHHSSLKSLTYIISSICFFILSYYLIDNYQLYGIAIAQIIQSLLNAFLSVVLVKIVFKKLSFKKLNYDKVIFKKIFSYSLNFQMIGILNIFTEPIMKMLLSKFGGLSFVGYFEMANRLIQQAKSLITSANQVLVPYVSKNISKHNTNDQSYPLIYKLSFSIAVLTLIFFLIFTPVISVFWLKQLIPNFQFSLIIMTVGISINLITNPAYFSCMGIGDLVGILRTHIILLILNVILCYSLGFYLGGYGVIIGYSISIIISSLNTLFYYHFKYNLKSKAILFKNTKENILFIVYILISTIIYLLFVKILFPFYIFLGVFIILSYIINFYLHNRNLFKVNFKIN